jgi:hypothetical protein
MKMKNRHHMYAAMLLLCLAALFQHRVIGQKSGNSSNEDASSERVVARARKAIYADIRAESVQSLSLIWKTRHQKPNGEQDLGELSYDILLPDKLLIKKTRNLTGNRGQIVVQSILNGAQSRSDLYVSSNDIPVMREDGGRVKKSNDGHVDSGANEQDKQTQAIRKEQAFQLLFFMLPASPDFPLTFKYVGEAKAVDGQADVIDVKGPNDFAVRIFTDKITSRLLMMIYRDEGMFKLKAGARSVGKGNGATSQYSQTEAEVKIRFADYKMVSGVMAPHLVTYENNGKIFSQLDLKDFKLNPVLAPGYFDPNRKNNR